MCRKNARVELTMKIKCQCINPSTFPISLSERNSRNDVKRTKGGKKEDPPQARTSDGNTSSQSGQRELIYREESRKLIRGQSNVRL